MSDGRHRDIRLWVFPQLEGILEPIEKAYWLALLNLDTMTMHRASTLSGMSRRNIFYRLKKLGIERNKETGLYEPVFKE